VKRTYDVPLSFRLGEEDGCHDHPEDAQRSGIGSSYWSRKGRLSLAIAIIAPLKLTALTFEASCTTGSFYQKFPPSQLRDRGCLPAILLTYQGALPCCGCGVPFISRMTGHICGCICSLVHTPPRWGGTETIDMHHADGL
jgi:hypothetical protein